MMHRIVLMTFLLSIQTAVSQTSQTTFASVEGVIIDRTTDKPVEDARVTLTLTEFTGPRPSALPSIPTTTTGPDGKFAFKGILRARYSISISCNGYAQQMYGQRTFPGEGTTLELSDGQAIKDIKVRLIPTGTVSGRVYDEEYHVPVADIPVQLMKSTYSIDGRRTLQPLSGTRTDDRGEYRLYFVTPGRYYLKVGGVVLKAGTSINTSTIQQYYDDVFKTAFSPAYYPDVPTLKGAMLLNIKPGSQLSGIDIKTRKLRILPNGDPEKSYRIRGRIIDSRTGERPGLTTNVSVYQLSDLGWVKLQPLDGYNGETFELRGLTPGSYQVTVTASLSPRASGFITGVARVEIVDADVDGIVLSMSLGIALQGKVHVEGAPVPGSTQRIRIVTTSVDGIISKETQIPMPASGAAASDVPFNLEGIPPGNYRVSVMGLPQGFFAKKVRLGPLDARRSAAAVSDREAGPLNILISSNAASVQGVVNTEKFQPAEGSTVVLVPERDRDRMDLFQSATADRDGRFAFPSVTPGNYRIFAWEALEQYAYFDLDLLRQVEQRGKPLQLSESISQTISLTAIPSD